MRMIAIVLLGLVAFAGAAPHWDHHRYRHGHLSPFDGSLERYLDHQMFDTQRFWEEFSRDMDREMRELEIALQDFTKHFPSLTSSEGIEGNEYKITIPLTGFDEKDIVVKAKRGLLMVQAVHKDNGQPVNNYLDMRSLPVCVKEGGSWSYQNNKLTIVLPIVQSDGGDITPTETTVTQTPNYSREDTEKPWNENTVDADVGLDRGDLGQNNELQTNEIPKSSSTVEATTYAVDLKDEVEFVHVNY